MQYWPIDAFQMQETLAPLLDFIQKMVKGGQFVAKSNYDCPGWVQHGFTDGFMHGGMLSTQEWAFCVSWYVMVTCAIG